MNNRNNTWPRHIRRFKRPTSIRESKSGLFDKLKGLVGLLATGGSVFVVLFYLGGRSFASGYFEAMNIPSYHVSFSIWEYGEAGWLPLFLYPFAMVMLGSLFWGVLFAIRDILGILLKSLAKWFWNLHPWLAIFDNWVKRIINKTRSSLDSSMLSKETKSWFVRAKIAFAILLFVYMISLALIGVEYIGEYSGRLYLLRKAPQIELASNNALIIDDIVPTSSKINQQSYFYNGFHLLTFNNGKYYLFKEIDYETCKPKKVYIVETKESLQVSLLPPISLVNQCK